MKVEVLVDANLLDEGLALSNEILSKNHLTGYHLTNLYIERALIFEIMEDFPSSYNNLTLAKKYIDKSERIKNKYYATWLIRVSSWYRIQKKRNKSFQFALKAKQFAEEHNDTSKSSEAGILLAFYYFNKKNYNKSIQLNKKAIAVGKKLNNKISVTYLYLNLSEIYEKLDNEALAYKYIDSAFNHIKNTNYLETKAESYLKKSNVFEAQKKLDSALYYYKNAVAFEKAHNFNLKTIKMNEQTLDFELEKEKIQKEKIVTENKTLQKNILLILIVAIVLLAFLIQENRRKKQIDKQKLIIEKDALKLEKTVKDKTFLIHEINHRIKNNLAVILSLIEIQGQENNKSSEELIKQLHDRVNTIAIGHQLFSYDMETTKTSFVNVAEYAKNIFETKQSITTKKFNYKIETTNIELKVDIALPFGLVLNELITNSIKHAKPPKNKDLELQLHLVIKDNSIEVIYKDNGNYFPDNANPEAMGIYIIKGMLNQISGTYNRKQSTFFITIPYAKTS
ncbi:sensor histidine kinase [Lacinutrix sp. C3R15]|uniref:sensor histidine kinase n=1 Tax=Flavobacteriaceae TaxID=49546 RepID=UPI001C08C725|nr:MULTISPECIES: sensor histidine kinase [Flavobacteriaceae]MBU2940790.1 sensor histidine kinase [Lacinutrix sp. C3R15]MDO6624108.1 sensor histidine kinase [Oceanihabitans sp. 1_MG-2023]